MDLMLKQHKLYSLILWVFISSVKTSRVTFSHQDLAALKR
jgi:hypothetical protein